MFFDNIKQGLAKFKSLFITFLLVSSFFLGFAKAQTTQEIINNQINQQDWITRQQQNQIEEQRRVKEEEIIKKEVERKKKEQEKNTQEKLTLSDKPAKCFTINSISMIDAKSISPKIQKNLTDPFIGSCVKGRILSKISNKIEEYYHQNGFIAAKVMVPKQNIKSGNLLLKIYEGKIAKLLINEDKITDQMQEITAFGFLEGDVLNINDVNQGIYQINRLPSNSAVMKLEPAKHEGEANIIIANQNQFPARVNINYDNLGSEFTGIKRTTFSSNFDNFLFLNDAINVSYTTNLDDNSKEKELKSFSSGISVPLAYNTISFDYSRTDFRGTNKGQNATTILTGYSNRKNITFERLLLNKGNLRISGNANLTTKESASYLNKEKITNSQRKLAIANIGLNISNYFKNGTNITLNPSYSQGLRMLGAKKDQPYTTADTAKAQFQLFKFYGNISKKVTIAKNDAPILLSSEVSSQISKHTLFGSESFSVGGYYSVRGFRENYINGDSGYHLRNKANFNLGQILVPLFAEKDHKESSLLSKNSKYLYKFTIEPFYDYGYVRNRYNDQSGRLSGAGLKTMFNSKYFTASLTYSCAINKSSLITSEKKENKMVFFELGLKLF